MHTILSTNNQKQKDQVKNMKVKTKYLLLFLVFSTLLLASIPSFNAKKSEVSWKDSAAKNNIIKRLGISDTVVSPIFIDGDATGIGAQNWSWVEGQTWFGGGNGSISNPYIIEDLIINGGDTVSCIEIRDSGVYFIIRSCTLYNSGYTPVPSKAGIFLENVDNGTIIRNNISYNGGHGISLANCKYNTIEDNLISDNFLRAIYLSVSHYNKIQENSVIRNAQDIWLTESNFNKVYNNTVRDNPTNGGIQLGSCSFNNLSYNILDHDLLLGIHDSSGRHNIIFRNLISDTIETGINIRFNNNCSIIENIVENNQNTGIDIERSNNITITDNNISKNGGTGLTFGSPTIGQFHKILRNNITYNDMGIRLHFSQHNLVSSNNISHNTNLGLNIAGDNNLITNNKITNNGQGLYLYFGDNNNIIQNNIGNNLGYGIFNNGGNLSLIYNNSFYGNTPNGIGNNNIFNYWDNGIIGNYWDDYVGLDVNDDGIGDIPYTKDKIVDNFPIYWDPPLIDIVPPIPEAAGLIAPSFNILISEGVAHSMWYTIEGGTTKYYFVDLIANINQTEWDKYGNENVTIQFYVNDSRGFGGFTELIILKDPIAPTSIISYTAYRLTNIINTTSTFTITASDLGGSGIQLIRYKINDSSWITYDKPFNFSGYSSGFYLITYQAIDNVGNVETEHTLLVELISSEPSTIPGYDLVIMIGTISLISILLIKKRFQE